MTFKKLMPYLTAENMMSLAIIALLVVVIVMMARRRCRCQPETSTPVMPEMPVVPMMVETDDMPETPIDL